MVLDIQTVGLHHILKNIAVQNVNKPFVYITDLTSTLTRQDFLDKISQTYISMGLFGRHPNFDVLQI
jgi:hypothetical protein